MILLWGLMGHHCCSTDRADVGPASGTGWTGPGEAETGQHTAVFDGDVKVRYSPEKRLPRHASAAFRVVAGIARRRDLGGSGRREDDERE
jgi:hypothetical protein